MEAPTAAPRVRSIRETVLESVAAYHQQQRMRRRFRKSLSYAGELSSAGRAAGASTSASLASLAGPEDDDETFLEEEEESTVELVQLGANHGKNVLILTSDTGGGHRLLRSHQGRLRRRPPIFVKDLCKGHAGGPLNNMGGSYKFMVKHVQLWKLPFHGTSPRWSDSDYTALRCYLY